jgi:hypothetical protein
VQNPKHDIEIDNAILRTLMYFDIFGYPLKQHEILNFLTIEVSMKEIELGLARLVASKQILQANDLYALTITANFERRLAGNALADKLLPRIKERADLIFKFPFVRGVMASGSFSKNYMDEKSDFDFFIVCAPERIWISRMLLVLYKKIFLKNSHREFCINYFIDETHLEITEKNIFSATELATVFPLTAFQVYGELMAANFHWLQKIFPNVRKRPQQFPDNKASILKSISEAVINLLGGKHLNRLFKKITSSRWQRVYKDSYTETDFNLAFESTDHISKNHPRNFQVKILRQYHQRVNELHKPKEVV